MSFAKSSEEALMMHNDRLLDIAAETIARVDKNKKIPIAIKDVVLGKLWIVFNRVKHYNVEGEDELKLLLEAAWLNEDGRKSENATDENTNAHRLTLKRRCEDFLGYMFEFGPSFEPRINAPVALVDVNGRSVVFDKSDSDVYQRSTGDRYLWRFLHAKFLSYVERQKIWIVKHPPTKEENLLKEISSTRASIEFLQNRIVDDQEEIIQLQDRLENLEDERW